jgi:preprotein translocase subunit YajC
MKVTTYTLAQASQPVAPGGQGAGQGKGTGPDMMLFGLILMFVVFYLVMFRGQSKDRKKKKEMIEALKKNDRVVTIGGVVGVVVSVKSDEVVVKVDESTNTKITFLRSAIQKVLTEDAETP